MKTIKPSDVSTAEFHQILLGTVAPRPIAFASTVNENGEVNLSPFSFFNVFSANPPIMIFSPARRVRDNTSKHTLENVLKIPEVAISIVNYGMVEQMSLASTEYETGVNEFAKAGFTALKSAQIRPPYVGESPASYECKVLEVKSLGENGGAGNLVICEVIAAHLSEDIFTDGSIDPHKLDAVARLGGAWYSRASGDSLFTIDKPGRDHGIGVDQIPKSIRNSHILSGNDLGRLGGVAQLPTEEEIEEFSAEPEVSAIIQDMDLNTDSVIEELHLLAKKYLLENNIIAAWKVLLQEY
ncbi:MAG: flavin reductase (DIM6/NTAB) family NADH-FMN oxidoreductase RutF [Marinoscillum sp.]|jgi:flavin reductase (DIM6/NTAB) family NADH-FMN oxidoreductase RutF